MKRQQARDYLYCLKGLWASSPLQACTTPWWSRRGFQWLFQSTSQCADGRTAASSLSNVTSHKHSHEKHFCNIIMVLWDSDFSETVAIVTSSYSTLNKILICFTLLSMRHVFRWNKHSGKKRNFWSRTESAKYNALVWRVG